MRILFVVIDYLTTPLGILYLSTIAKQLGHEVDVTSIHLPSFMDDIRDFKPDIIGFGFFSVHYFEVQKAVSVARQTCKKIGIKPLLIAGGIHASVSQRTP